MLLTFERAQAMLRGLAMGTCGMTVACVFFAWPFHKGAASPLVYAGVGLLGLWLGIIVSYRSSLGTGTALAYMLFIAILLEVFMAGCTAGLAMQIAGRDGLAGWAFSVNALLVVSSLFCGYWLAKKRLVSQLPQAGDGTAALAAYVNADAGTFDPRLAGLPTPRPGSFGTAVSIIGPLIANIPLLWQAQGFNRYSLIFLLAPAMTALFVYANLNDLGPQLMRLRLLRMLERQAGKRFTNTDYEAIQDLRRTWWESRWLMKDYKKTVVDAAVPVKSNRQLKRLRKNRP